MAIKPSEITAIIFDLDGTIVHLPIHWTKLKQELFQNNLLHKHQSITNAINNIKSGTDSKKLIQLLSILSRYETNSTNNFKTNQNIVTWIKLNKSNYQFAICSSNLHSTIKTILKKIGVYKYFGQLIGNEDVNKLKPDPEGITRIITHLHLNTTKTVFIGDKPSDLQAATRAGINYFHSRQLTNFYHK